MIQSLQKKLIAATTVCLAVILLVMIALINAVSSYSAFHQVSQSLEVLAGTQTDNRSTQRIRENLPDVTASSLYRVSNYCILRLTRDGQLYEWKSENTQLYNDETVAQILSDIQAHGGDRGRVGQRMFRIAPGAHGDRIAVIDIRTELENAASLLRITAVVGILFWVLLSVLAAVLICRLLRPVSLAFAKQQQFVWDASHELKTPLAVISANAQVLSCEIGPNENLGYILDEVERTNTLVQNLLCLARMDAKRVKGEIRELDLGKLLLQTALPMESLIFEQGKTLVLQIPEGIGCHGNEALLQELVVILLSNAVQYSAPGSQITLSLQAKGSHRILCVHNTGSFIPPEIQAHIFERFYRGDASHSRETGGSGLGLAIAKSIADFHQGSIRVESTPETGTAFLVTRSDHAG